MLARLGSVARAALPKVAKVAPISAAAVTAAPLRSIHVSKPLRAFKFDATIGLNDDQKAIQEAAVAFAQNEMLPHVAKWDEEKFFPKETLRKAAEMGFAGVYIKEDVGGMGLGRLDAALIFEALATACPSTASYLTVHNMATWMVDTFGSEAQRQKYVPKMASLEYFGSYCLTEPSSGSDAASLQTKAVKQADGSWVLNGTKAFISGGGTSDVYLVMARTGGPGPKGISCFIVEKGFKGISFGPNEKKLGWNSHPTAMVILEDCVVPAENLLGTEGAGFSYAMKGLDGGRINIAAMSIGGAQAAFNYASAYTGERKQFGKALNTFQSVEFKLADMATELTAARLMVHRAAELLDAKSPDATMHCAMAKRFATDAGYKIVNDALQLHGGYGYLKDYPIEKLVRDLRVHQILEGTNEIMRMIIARNITKA